MLRLASWAVKGMLAEHRLRAAFFTGEESQKRRTQNLVDFHDDPSVRVLFSTGAGGVGLAAGEKDRAVRAAKHLDVPTDLLSINRDA